MLEHPVEFNALLEAFLDEEASEQVA